jgi:D-alanyl-D-alanine carboxypeptidase/D-alanyl-D-alanine-endopeptidase (penicillin-binding protein 4)
MTSSPLHNLQRVIRRRLRQFDTHLVSSDTQRATASIIVAAALLFIPLFSAWQVANAAAGRALPLTTATNDVDAAKEPILSVRRIAQTAAIEARVARVRTSLAAFAQRLPAGACLLASADGRPLVSVEANTALIPASNMKLLVAAAALDVLGEEYRFETRLAGVRSESSIAGDLWLVGGGDPLLSTRGYPPTQRYPTIAATFLDTLADELVAEGITSVTGSVVGDESRFDTERYVPTWGDGIRAIEAGPLSALMVDDGTVPGAPLKPSNPALGAATSFTRLLQARGIQVSGAPRVGQAPGDAPVLARLTSAPLSVLLTDVLANSDNNATELIVKEIGLVGASSPTRVAGLQVMADVLADRGIPVEGAVFADGSGLDSGNRVTCTTLHSLLQASGPASSIGTSLALAGTTGTLRDVLKDGPANNRVRAKTGTLRNVKTLSGFFPTTRGTIVFALMLNGQGVSNQSTFLPLWEALMDSFAGYREDPSAEQLLPR